jgi:hypothetical protein
MVSKLILNSKILFENALAKNFSDRRPYGEIEPKMWFLGSKLGFKEMVITFYG